MSFKYLKKDEAFEDLKHINKIVSMMFKKMDRQKNHSFFSYSYSKTENTCKALFSLKNQELIIRYPLVFFSNNSESMNVCIDSDTSSGGFQIYIDDMSNRELVIAKKIWRDIEGINERIKLAKNERINSYEDIEKSIEEL